MAQGQKHLPHTGAAPAPHDGHGAGCQSRPEEQGLSLPLASKEACCPWKQGHTGHVPKHNSRQGVKYTVPFLKVSQQCQVQKGQCTPKPPKGLRQDSSQEQQETLLQRQHSDECYSMAQGQSPVSHHVNQKEFSITCSYVLMPGKFHKDAEQYY